MHHPSFSMVLVVSPVTLINGPVFTHINAPALFYVCIFQILTLIPAVVNVTSCRSPDSFSVICVYLSFKIVVANFFS